MLVALLKFDDSEAGPGHNSATVVTFFILFLSQLFLNASHSEMYKTSNSWETITSLARKFSTSKSNLGFTDASFMERNCKRGNQNHKLSLSMPYLLPEMEHCWDTIAAVMFFEQLPKKFL